jgi:hypothetical protein
VARWKQNTTDGAPWMYCCVGAEFNNNYSSACVDGGTPFSLPSASVIYGFAGLANA